MRLSYPAFAVIAALAACNPASAQSTTDILQRLEALEKSNADLKKENAALRDRVRRIETVKQTPSATPAAYGSAPESRVAPGYAAASMPSVYKAMPMGVPPAFSWTGFYVGAHGGYAWARSTVTDVAFEEHGGFGGIQTGVNYQFWGPWVLGIENDASLGDIKGSTPLVCGNPPCGTQGTATVTFDALGSFRERVGYAWDRVLLYQTAGVAWADGKPHIVITGCSGADQSCVVGATFDDRRLMTGLAAGGGIEVAATANLTFKAEYLYLDFPDKNFLAGTTQKAAVDERIHTVRAGVNWLFH